MNAVFTRNPAAFDSEMQQLRTQLSGWFEEDLRSVPDDRWAEAALKTLKTRGFQCIENATHSEVLFCLGRQEVVHVSRAPNRALAIARSIRQFADNAGEANLLKPSGNYA